MAKEKTTSESSATDNTDDEVKALKALVKESSKSVKLLVTTVNTLLTKFDTLMEEVGELRKENAALKDTIAEFQRAPPTQRNASFNASEIAKLVGEVVAEKELMREKSHRAVIEKFEESGGPDNNITANNDADFIQKMAQHIGIAANEVVVEKCHRYGVRKVGRSRLIKVQFSSKKARDSFLFGFRKNLSNFPQVNKKVSVRRDMVQSELDKYYELKKEAYDKNVACGMFKYFVSDLILKEISNAQPLKAASKSKH